MGDGVGVDSERAGAVGRVLRWADTVPEGEWLFSSRLRHAGWWWLVASLPLSILIGALVQGEGQYIAWWVLVSGLYTTPAMFNGWVVCRRTAGAERGFWLRWLAGTASLYLVGCVLLVSVATGSERLHYVSGVFAVAATVAYTSALVGLMRRRSGSRAVMVDVLEVGMLTTGVVALVVLPFAGPILASETRWFTLPSAIVAVCLVSSFCWAMVLIARLDRGSRTLEALGALLALLCIVNAGAQVAQGLSGFTLPAVPLFLLQAVCMWLLMMTPLFQPKVNACGLDRLPPHAQVRSTFFASVLVIALLGALLVETAVLGDTVGWATSLLVAVALTQLVLLAARYQLATNETKRLYARVQAAAEERRRLLTEIIQSVDHDRHRVAARLHEQATSSYVAFTAYLQAHRDLEPADEAGRPGSLGAVREELAGQAETLRQLMLAVKPLEGNGPGPRRLTAPITAYVDSLYGDQPAPVLIIDIEDDVELDWTSETVAFRILQEALRNVWGHADARHVRVAVGLDGDRLALRVEDDGRGFRTDALLYESGIATMRAFAELHGGSLAVSSTPGVGTSVVAHLGAGPMSGAVPDATSGTAAGATGADRSSSSSEGPAGSAGGTGATSSRNIGTGRGRAGLRLVAGAASTAPAPDRSSSSQPG